MIQKKDSNFSLVKIVQKDRFIEMMENLLKINSFRLDHSKARLQREFQIHNCETNHTKKAGKQTILIIQKFSKRHAFNVKSMENKLTSSTIIIVRMLSNKSIFLYFLTFMM